MSTRVNDRFMKIKPKLNFVFSFNEFDFLYKSVNFFFFARCTIRISILIFFSIFTRCFVSVKYRKVCENTKTRRHVIFTEQIVAISCYFFVFYYILPGWLWFLNIFFFFNVNRRTVLSYLHIIKSSDILLRQIIQLSVALCHPVENVLYLLGF